VDEATIIRVLGGGGGLTIAVVILRALYVQWSKQNPGLEQAGAAVDIYSMLRTELREMQKERKLMRRQIVLLEGLCTKHGLDIHELYRSAGMGDEDDPDPTLNPGALPEKD
jgi:hypothetical protein